MKKQQVFAIITYVLVAVGGILATTGVVTSGLWETISGAVIGLTGAVWAAVDGIKKQNQESE